MKMHSSRRMPVAPLAKPIVKAKRLRTRRHHASEPWKPRATDLCGDRMAALASCLALCGGPFVLPGGEHVDARTLESMADEQLAREHELQEIFGRARVVYEDYHRATNRVREVLIRGIAQFDGRIDKRDSIARTALRTAKLRLPPKTMIARLKAIVAKRRGGDADEAG